MPASWHARLAMPRTALVAIVAWAGSNLVPRESDALSFLFDVLLAGVIWLTCYGLGVVLLGFSRLEGAERHRRAASLVTLLILAAAAGNLLSAFL